MPLSSRTPHSVVLDTNAVLDCWLFEDPRAAALRRAIEEGRLRWQATTEMLDELVAVLARPLPSRRDGVCVRLLSADAWRRHEVISLPAQPLLPVRLCCTDTDDQKFLDLAVHLRARWLVTRDRAVLRLADAAAQHGVAIVAPADWPGV